MFKTIATNIANSVLDPKTATQSVSTNSSKREASHASTGSSNRELDTTSSNPELVKMLEREGLKLGIHPENFYSSEGLSSYLLDGPSALRIFDSNTANKQEGKQSFLATIFDIFKKPTSEGAKNSPLKTFYLSTHHSDTVDHVGEPWEHFRKALATGHYRLMPIYNSGSKSILEPVAFTVFERSGTEEAKTSLFKKLANNSFNATDIKSNNINFLDKIITNGFDKSLDMNALQRSSIESFLNAQARDTIVLVPWQADSIGKLSRRVIKGINHIGFAKTAGELKITPRHIVEGQEYHTIKATTIYTRYPRDFEAKELKALVTLQTLSEVSAGPEMRFTGTRATKQIKGLLEESFKNIDEMSKKSKLQEGSQGFSFNPFKLLAGFMRA